VRYADAVLSETDIGVVGVAAAEPALVDGGWARWYENDRRVVLSSSGVTSQ
jgi:hypothetical protein